MKKIITILLAALFAAVSCKKSDNGGEDIDLSGYTVFNVDTEQLDLVEGESFQDTWAEGSTLGLYAEDYILENVEYFLKRSGIDKKEAVFYGPLVDGESYLAYYPYSEYMELEDGMIPCMLSSDQLYSPELTATSQFRQYCRTVVASSDDRNVLKFRYPFGMVSVQIRFDDVLTVKGMTMTSKDKKIAGRMLVDGYADTYPSSVASDKIQLSFEQPVASRDESGKFTTFYFVMPPAEYASKSLSLYIDAEEGQMSVMLKSITVERVKGKDFPITNVVVDMSDLPVFNPVDGYLE